jgi:tyrosyl-tRNA synthetase
MSRLYDELQWRGLLHQATDPKLAELLDSRLTAYIGFDPTGDSLHAGSLMQLLNLLRLKQGGHQVIALVGGGTGLVGDPSFRAEERELLSEEQLAANLEGIRRQMEAFLGPDTIFVDNADWLRSVPLTDFLRDVGKHFSVNEMVRKESVRSRLEAREQGMSFTEFAYMLLQAWDFVQLFDRYGCTLQMGGSDQWGNITEGIDLIRRLRGGQAYGITTPLLTLPGGAKMGKTEGATRVWLDKKRTSPYQFFQYWVRADDEQVGTYLRFFTFLDHERIVELDRATVEHAERREAQQALAWEVTSLVHGEAEAAKAKHAAEVLFTEDVAGLDEATLLDVMADAPSSAVGREGIALVDALVSSGLAKSKSAARTAIEQGGAYINNRREQSMARRITVDDALHGRYVLLRRGKRDHHLILLSEEPPT